MKTIDNLHEKRVTVRTGAVQNRAGHCGMVAMISTEGKVFDTKVSPAGATTELRAAWRSVILGLKLALEHGAYYVTVQVDNPLLAKLMASKSEIKDPRARGWLEEIRQLEALVGDVQYATVSKNAPPRVDGLALNISTKTLR